MYEILLGSKGIMQLGWATLICRFTNEVSQEKLHGKKKKINNYTSKKKLKLNLNGYLEAT